MSSRDLPALNAALNGISATLLLLGFLAIRRGRRETHRRFKVAALVTSGLFLDSYLTYHGPIRAVYFVILLTHVVLAVVNLPLVITTVLRAYRGDFERHRKIAKLTWGMWMYVSVTGVLVYLMLYRWFPGTA